MVLRPVTLNDLKQLERLVGQIGFGMGASLHTDHNGLEKKVQHSLHSFTTSNTSPYDSYLFVLEIDPGIIIGICGIETVNRGEPFYSFRLGSEVFEAPSLQFRKEIPTIQLVEAFTGATNLCTQFLLPEYRGNGFSKLLNGGRLLYIAEHPERFNNTILGELRGAYDADGYNPFWKYIGQHFFKHMDYPSYVNLLHKGFEQELLQLLPKAPIYLPLLPPAAQQAIQTFHPETRPNLRSFFNQGFRFSNHVGYSSGAPILKANRSQLVPLRDSRLAQFDLTPQPLKSKKRLMSNAASGLAFRACLAPVEEQADHTLTVSHRVVNDLQAVHKQVRVVMAPAPQG